MHTRDFDDAPWESAEQQQGFLCQDYDIAILSLGSSSFPRQQLRGMSALSFTYIGSPRRAGLLHASSP